MEPCRCRATVGKQTVLTRSQRSGTDHCTRLETVGRTGRIRADGRRVDSIPAVRHSSLHPPGDSRRSRAGAEPTAGEWTRS